MFGNRLQNQHYQGGSLGSNSFLYTSIQSAVSLGSQSLGPFYSKQMEAASKARMASSPHHHARIAATHSRMQNINQGNSNTTLSQVSQTEQNLIPRATPLQDNSSWHSLDLGGMMINHLNNALFSYTFLTALYLNHNNLTSLPPAISKLRNLSTLNVTGNKLSSLPVELGLIVSLKELLLFDNQLTYIPPDFGTLYQLEIIGLEGNPLSEPIASMLNEKGTASVIKYLRDSCPCMCY
jgi:CCR4-NOT transcription complex subunit 6